MKILLLITLTFIIFSCKSEKIIYVEQDVKTLEGTWDIEGVWRKVSKTNVEGVFNYDTLLHNKEIIDFYLDYKHDNYPHIKNYFKTLDTIFEFAENNSAYYDVYYYGRMTSTESIKFFNFDILYDSSMVRIIHPGKFWCEIDFYLNYLETDSGILTPDYNNAIFSLQTTSRINDKLATIKVDSTFQFIGKGKRIK